MEVKGSPHNCENCGDEFVKSRFDQRFCSKACSQAWYNAKASWSKRPDREAQNARKRTQRAGNPEYQALKRADRKLNPEKYRAQDKRKYERHRTQILEKERLGRLTDPEKYRAKTRHALRKMRENSAWKFLLHSASRRAQRKHVPFDLTHAWAASRWTGKCELTNVPFDATNSSLVATIDRIEAAKGYTQDNCRFILYALNAMRGSGTDEDLYKAAIVILSALVQRLHF